MDSKIAGKEKHQLTSLKDSDEFIKVFEKIILNDKNIDAADKEYILLCAMLFFKAYNNDNRYRSYFKIAYYIILKYSLIFKDYRPLYDMSIQIGFYPICKVIVDKNLIELESIYEILSQSIIKSKYVNEKEKYIETLEQKSSIEKLTLNNSNYIGYIAPTSFGKSSFIKDYILKNNFFKIGIIVPTKSLLIQTYNDIKKENLSYKLILHDEMFDKHEKFIGILTQERASRLLQKGTFFDVLFIDEAHNILKFNSDNSRGLILSRLIKQNESKNPNHKVVYLSPLINNIQNLKLEKDQKIFSSEIKHNLKCEDIFLWEKNTSEIFDRFTGKYYKLKTGITYFEYIKANSQSKNFIYNFKPIYIEKLAENLYKEIQEIEIDLEIEKIITTLEKEIHKSFYVNKYIKKGIVYIHGKIPNLIKEYLEYKFKENKKLKYIIANKVILEGINLPIDTLFITSTRYLEGKELTNLIGRVNRLNYVFKENDLEKLNPKIHFLNKVDYQDNASVRNKIELLRNHSFKDIVENPLLFEYNIDSFSFSKNDNETKEQVKERRRLKDEKIINDTNFLTLNSSKFTVNQKIERYFIENNIDDFYIDLQYVIPIIKNKIDVFKIDNNWKDNDLVTKIYYLFIHNLENNIKDYEIERLKNPSAQKYYNFYIEVTQKQSLKQNIMMMFDYFKKKAQTSDPFLFIGKSYGDVIRYSDIYNANKYKDTVYVNLKGKSDEKLINLSIVKLKIEEDFVSFKLNKLIVFLYDFDLISLTEYNNYIYGTDNEELIKLAKLGLSLNIINKLLEDNQFENLRLDENGNLISNHIFNEYIINQPELFKFEVNKYL
jgi:hypothetical protein